MWTEVTEFPIKFRNGGFVLGGVLDTQSGSPLDRLTYVRVDDGELDGDALVQLQSGAYIRIREYRTTVRPGAYSVYLHGGPGSPDEVFSEFLVAANLTVNDVVLPT